MPKRVLVVGAGLTGATVARTLADAGVSVEVVEKRDRVGGNCADYLHEAGCYVGLHGPHYFRTSNEKIWQWANRFAAFYPYEARIKTWVDGRYEDWPVQADYCRRVAGHLWEVDCVTRPPDVADFETVCLAKMPEAVYSKVVAPYTRKQWDCDPKELDATLAARVEVRTDGDTRLKKCKYQGLPRGGYTAWIGKMLEGIPITLGGIPTGFGFSLNRIDPWEVVRHFTAVVYTGPLDALFGYDLGRLRYRGQKRGTSYLKQTRKPLRPCGQVNFPGSFSRKIRHIEWNYLMESPCWGRGVVITSETPFSPTDPDECEYPFPAKQDRELAAVYKKRADAIPGLVVAGRLGTYKYYDMDQAISHGLTVAQRIINGDRNIGPGL